MDDAARALGAFVLLGVLLALCRFVGHYAIRKGLRPTFYVGISLLLSPVVGLLLVAAAKPNEEVAKRNAGFRKCAQCAEWIREEALKCHYCGAACEPIVAAARHVAAAKATSMPAAEPQKRAVEPQKRKVVLCGKCGRATPRMPCVYCGATTVYGISR